MTFLQARSGARRLARNASTTVEPIGTTCLVSSCATSEQHLHRWQAVASDGCWWLLCGLFADYSRTGPARGPPTRSAADVPSKNR